MNTSALSLDFYDDVDGKLVKNSFPTSDSLPEIVKTAHILSSEEQSVLRDEAFALVLLNEGKTLRKFACVDAGNTYLSALYFLENKDKLPEEAQKVAMANIVEACEEFGIQLLPIEKIAAKKPTKTVVRTRDPMKTPMVGDEADWSARTNLSSVTGTSDAGTVRETASQLKTATKKDVNLDSFHKLNPEAKPKKKPCGKCGGTSYADIRGNLGDCCIGEKKEKKKVANLVDVSGLSAPVISKKASAEHLALGRYPLDSFNDVEAAVRYFSEWRNEMSPSDRHEFAVKTASRANDLNIPLTEELERYGSTEYAPDVDSHLASRRSLAPEFNDVWNTLQEKRASIEPSVFASLLEKADQEASLNWYYGSDLSDPYFVTFGGNAVKEANAAWSWMSDVGDYVSGEQLAKLARNGRPLVEKQFDSGLALAFARDPITIFESLPAIQKTLLARLATQEFDGLPTN